MKTKKGNSKNSNFKNEKVMETKANKLELRHYHWLSEMPSLQGLFFQRQFVNLFLKTAFIFSLLAALSALKSNAADYYWVGGTGNWNDFASHWATTSGGNTFHTSVPGVNDDVFFDDNSFAFIGTDTVFVFVPTIPTCRNFSFVNSTPVTRGGFASSSIGGHVFSFSIHGNLGISGPIANYGFSNSDVLNFSFWSTQAVQFIQTSGNRMNIDLYSSNTATYNLLDDLDGSFLVRNGRLNTNGHTLNITSLWSRVEYQGIIDFGTSIINSFIDEIYSFEICCGGRVIADNAVFNLHVTSFIHNNNTNTSATIKEISAKNIYVINDTIGLCSVSGIVKASSALIRELHLNGTSSAFFNDTSYISTPTNHIEKCVMNADTSSLTGYTSGLTTLIDTLIVNTSCKNVVLKNGYNTNILSELEINTTPGLTSVSSDIAGFPTTITKSNGTLCFDYLSIKDVTVNGGAQFFAGTNSIDLGGNTGWNFTSCPPPTTAYYWVGGTGNWSDVSHWATTSGGTTFHTSPPDSTSDVYFDANSFSSTSTVSFTSTGSYIECHNFTCSGITDSMLINNGVALGIKIYGSVMLDSMVFFNNTAYMNLVGNGNNYWRSNYSSSANNLTNLNLFFDCGQGRYDFIDGYNKVASFKIASGIINTRGLTIESPDFTISNSISSIPLSNLQVNFESSELKSSFNFVASNTYGAGGFLDLDSTYINIQGAFYGLNGGHTVHKINAVDVYINQFNVSEVTTLTFFGNQNTISKMNCSLIGSDNLSSFGKNIIDILSSQSGQFIFNGSQTVVNTLKPFYNPSYGKQFLGVLVESGDSLFILNYLNADTGYFQSLTSGQPSYFVCNAPQICFQNMIIKDVNVSGGGSFYAGNGCINAGGNSGFIWATCSPISNVWPGDANYDLIVNNIDVLNIGLAYNETGPVRSGASLAYVAQPATDWNGYFQTAINKKHADTNGDGVVNDNDTTAISLNYGLSHPARFAGQQQMASPNDPYLYLDVSPDSVNLSDTVYIESFYGTVQTPVDSVYGLAFTINYDTALVDTNWISNQFLNSWMGQPGVDLLTFVKSTPFEGKIDFALVRNDHANVAGFGGAITRTGIVIVDNVAGRMPVPFQISNAYALTASEFVLGINLGNDSSMLDTTALNIINEFSYESFTITPNPANDFIVLKNIPAGSIVEFYNGQGKIVLAEKTVADRNKIIDIRRFKKGIYNIRIYNENKMLVGKLVKL